MSYDLEIWSVDAPIRGHLDDGLVWSENGDVWSHAARDWQLVVDLPARVEPQDVSDQIASLLPGVTFLTRLSLEGVASKASLKKANSVAKAVARAVHGAVVDPQEETVVTPSGVKRLARIKRGERFSALVLTWWFLDGPLLAAAGKESLLGLIERDLPEVLPIRYGTYEPPEFKYATTGREHFLRFVTESKDLTIWTTKRPVVDVSLIFPKEMGGSWIGFRTNQFKIAIESELMNQPGWHKHLRQFWVKASALIQPIYGDVRILAGQPRSGYTTLDDPLKEHHPVRSWFWRGVPQDLGCGVVLGKAYQELWPEFAAAAEIRDGLAFVATKNWRLRTGISDLVGKPPLEIAAPPSLNRPLDRRMFVPEEYPRRWPFGSFYGGEGV